MVGFQIFPLHYRALTLHILTLHILPLHILTLDVSQDGRRQDLAEGGPAR